MTLDPEISRQLITLLSDRDNPGDLQYIDDSGRVVPHEETGLPTTITKADWLVV